MLTYILLRQHLSQQCQARGIEDAEKSAVLLNTRQSHPVLPIDQMKLGLPEAWGKLANDMAPNMGSAGSAFHLLVF